MLFLAAVLATLYLLHIQHETLLFAAGLTCLALLLIGCVMYHGNVFYIALTVAQKLTFVLFAA